MFQSRGDRRAAQELDRQRKALAKLTAQACELVLVRHGETDFNVESRLQGQMYPGPPLNSNGINQAEALAVLLEEEKFDALYTSDLQRTLETIEIVHKHHYNQKNLVITTESDLRERRLGQVEGKTMADARTTLPLVWLGLNTPNEASLQVGTSADYLFSPVLDI
jgi:probable phosphoglycerate mutase